MPTINQLVRKGRNWRTRRRRALRSNHVRKNEGLVCASIPRPEKAELRSPESGARSVDERHGSDHLHSGVGHNLPETLDCARARRSCKGLPGSAITSFVARSTPWVWRIGSRVGRSTEPSVLSNLVVVNKKVIPVCQEVDF